MDEARTKLAEIVQRNIEALETKQLESERQRSLQERVADGITAFAGSMPFVYCHLAIFGIWVAANTGWLHVKPFDPSLVKLATLASVEAIFLSTFVLISQNRMQEIADKRADLHLQIGLLAEHEITSLIKMVRAIAEKMDIGEAREAELDQLAQDIRPEMVLNELEQQEPPSTKGA